jgi:hypothetical protein
MYLTFPPFTLFYSYIQIFFSAMCPHVFNAVAKDFLECAYVFMGEVPAYVDDNFHPRCGIPLVIFNLLSLS